MKAIIVKPMSFNDKKTGELLNMVKLLPEPNEKGYAEEKTVKVADATIYKVGDMLEVETASNGFQVTIKSIKKLGNCFR